MTVEEARKVLRSGRALRLVIGTDPDDPTLIWWLDDGMVMSEAVKGWCAGTVEPVCSISSDYLRDSLQAKVSVEVVTDDDTGWERRGSEPRPEWRV